MPDRAAPPLRPTAATTLRPLVTAFLGEDPPIAVRCWDGSGIGDPASPATIVF